MTNKILLTPVQIGDLTLKNRITMSAMTRNRAENTYPTDVMKEYYVQRALGGAGLIIVEGILITRQGTEWPHAPGIWDANHISGWKTITDAVHAVGGKIYAQLWHVGRCSHPDAPEQVLAGTPVYAPSAISARGGKFRQINGEPGYVTPTTIDDPEVFVQLYKTAALNAKEAGFDGVEAHGANGYLITQFLDYTSNKRTDKWGGSIENRARFGLEVLKALIDVFGKNVAIKISPCGGYNDVGMPLQDTLDTYAYLITEADKLNLAYITLMRYHPYLDATFEGVPRATNHDVLASYKQYFKNTKLIINCSVTPEEGEELVSSGKVDAIAIGQNWISHPDLVKRFEYGKPLDNQVNFQFIQMGQPGGDWGKGLTDYPEATY